MNPDVHSVVTKVKNDYFVNGGGHFGEYWVKNVCFY